MGILDTLKGRMLNLAMNVDLGLRVHNMLCMEIVGKGILKLFQQLLQPVEKNTHFVGNLQATALFANLGILEYF